MSKSPSDPALARLLERHSLGIKHLREPGPDDEALAAMARYVRACDAALAAQSIDAMSSAGPAFAAWETC